MGGINMGIMNGRCRYNMRINCTERNKCDKCGWNPTVAVSFSSIYVFP